MSFGDQFAGEGITRRKLFPFLVGFTVLLLISCGGGGGTAKITTEEARVRSVIDGDTIETSLGRVRIIGIDAPEFEECFFEEARSELRRLIGDRTLTLVPDSFSENRDKYDRLLRYVEIQGKDIGAELLRNGFAKSFPWFPFERLESYERLAEEAQGKGRGEWGACP